MSFTAVTTNLDSLPTNTTAIYAAAHGNPVDVLHVGCIPLPDLSTAPNNSVLVRMLAAPVNPSDTNAIQGVYPSPLGESGIEGKQVPGFEGVGQVIALTGTDHDLKLGDLVLPYGISAGTWRRHLILLAKNLICVKSSTDPDISVEALSTLAVNPCTAYRMLRDFVSLEEGDVVVQNGGNSAVGQYVSQLANIKGIRVISVIRDRPDFDSLALTLKQRGAFQVIRPDDLRRFFNDKQWNVKLALNTIGGRSATDLLRVLSPGGTLVTYGAMSREPIAVPATALIFRDVTLRGFWMTEWKKKSTLHDYKSMLLDLTSLMAQGKLVTPLFNKVIVPEDDISTEQGHQIVREIGAAGSEFLGKKQLIVFP